MSRWKKIVFAAAVLVVLLIIAVNLVLVEPNVIVEFNDTGASNFLFDTAGDKTDESALSPPPLIFSHVLIENGLFTYKDAQLNFKFSVRIDRLTAEIPGLDKSFQIPASKSEI